MKRIAGYAISFLAGSLLAGGTTFAATNLVQAQKGTSVIEVNGAKVSAPPKLVYGGTTYVQLYSIQSGLQSVFGVRPTWNGTTFNVITTLPVAGSTSGESGSYYVTHPSLAKVAFTKADQHPELLLEQEMSNAKSTLDVAIYSITKPDIVDAIVAAEKRGVKVRVITDKTQAGNQYQKAELQTIKNAGIPIKENSHSGLMHLKVTIIDNKEVATGSFNYSKAASTTNDENLVVLTGLLTAKDYEEQFNRMWNDTRAFKDWTS